MRRKMYRVEFLKEEGVADRFESLFYIEEDSTD